MIRKILNLKFVIRNQKAGMTYVELIVVLSIFAVLSSVTIFNYGSFQDMVDIRNLASDITLKIVEAQKSSIDGVWPPVGANPSVEPWKPAYGVYFDISVPKQFIYFTDLDNDYNYGGLSSCASAECLDKITITKNNFISRIESCSNADCSSSDEITSPLSITFSRPSSSAIFNSTSLLPGFDHIRVTISSSGEATALIKIYPSGRVQVN